MNRVVKSTAPRAQRLTVWLTTITFAGAQLILPPLAGASHLGSSTASAGSAPPPSVAAIQSFQPDLFTGRATTAIPIGVPPGRKGMQPSLALAYSSSGRNGWVGVGWSLDVGYIERSTKHGVPKYDSDDTYTFMFQGVSSDLVRIPDGTYRAKDEGLFLRFEDKGLSGWEVRDKSGTRYRFGQTVASQIEDGGRVFRWCLDQVIDTNGNGLTIAYAKDQGQLYPATILYTTHATEAAAPTNRVDFVLEDQERPDPEVSYRAGFPVRTAKRLKAIVTQATMDGTMRLARRYDLTYTQSPRTGRSLLASITQVGTDGVTSLPATTFTYQDAAQPSYALAANNPSVSVAAWNVRKVHSEQGHENYGCEHPYRAFPWSSPVVVSGSTDLGCVSANVSSNGSITLRGCNDHYGHAFTYVYASSARTISLPLATGSDTEFCLWREDASSGVQRMTSSSVPLQAGWSLLHLVAYHQHQGWGPAWINGSVIDQVDIMSPSQFIKPQLTGDVNGDGMTDLLTFGVPSGKWTVSLSRGSAFSPETTWHSGFGTSASTPLLGDWNADGRTDIAIYENGAWQFATSTGTAFQTGTVSPLSFGSGTPLTGDFNGDGTMDLGTYNNGSWQVALGTGTGFSQMSSFSTSWGSSDHEPLTGDFNGDGLTDIAVRYKPNGDVSVRLSTGSGFTLDAKWIGGLFASQATTADFNGDGLTDVAYYDKATGQVVYAPSTGAGFAAPRSFPVTFGLRGTDDGLQVGDLNGDGLADPAVFNAVTSASELARSQGTFPDLLSGIANGIGGTTALEYQPSTQCDTICPIEGLPVLPFILPVVNRVTVSDGMGNRYTTTYVFRQGRYDAPTREFRGFATVEVRDAEANVTITQFHQDEHKKGRPFLTEFRDTFGNLWTKQEQTWSCREPFAGVHVVTLDQTDAFTYDGDATSRQTRARFAYDAYGNLTKTLEDGEPSVSGDERSTATTFVHNTADWILNKPSLIQTLDVAGAVVAQRRFYYDAAPDTTTTPTKGHLTKEEEWLNVPSERWLATALTYDTYGNVKTVTDALGRITTNAYDPTGTYLTTITNHLGHSRQLAYDPRFGQVTSSIDQNGLTTTTAYDALGRAIAAAFIDPGSGQPVTTSEIAYDLTRTPIKTTTTAYAQPNHQSPVTSYQFTDGLGRTIQTRAPAEDPAKQIVGDAVKLNSRGLAVKQWVPYLSTASTSYVPFSQEPSASSLAAVSYAYDPLGRLLTTTDPDGAVTAARYDDWSVTSTDANSHQTRRTSDAYGRLSTVEEFIDGTTATTRYAYDALGNLRQVTDAAGNITRITYDTLGRKIAMDDPDMGRWTYAYDAVDNLTAQTDARGITSTFTYDSLNRLTRKAYSNQQPAVSYQYDDAAKPFAKGKLTGVTDGSGSSSFEYDHLGRLVKETKTIDGTPYPIQRSYDLLGRLVSLTYPDGDVATYTYNNQGGIETVGLDSPVTGHQSLVTSIDYNAAGQLTKITYGNGTTTDYSYNPQTLRLSALSTQHIATSTQLQDFTYAFDAAGNVTGITDRVHTGSQSFRYDDLNRLTQATGTYGALTYRYDPLGNMTEKEGVTLTYGLADGSKPHAVTATSAGWTMQYDANGNMVEKAIDSRLSVHDLTKQTMIYDAENRLAEVATAQDEKVSVTFQPGWNFFSLPVIPEDGAVTVLLPSFAQDFEQLAKFEPTMGKFTHYVGNPKFDDFTDLEYGVGYQLYAKREMTVTFQGKLPTQRLSQSLEAGWHLLPAVSTQQSALSQTFGGLDYDQLLTWDTATQTRKPATEVQAAQAYWIHLRTAGTFAPSLPRDPTTRFVYDGDGGRVKQTVGGKTTTYLGEVYERDSTNKTTKYLFAGSLRIATKASDGELLFYHTDHLGSSNCITNAAGTMVELTEHLPYGAISRHEGTKDLPHKFTGQRQDPTNGLILFPARAYDPALGRFLQPDPFVQDPADPQTLNRYSYVRNNPVNLVDPSGYGFFKRIARVVGAAVGAVVGFFVCGPECVVTGAIIGYSIGDSVGAAIERRDGSGASSPSFASGSQRSIGTLSLPNNFLPTVPLYYPTSSGRLLSFSVRQTELLLSEARQLGVSTKARDLLAILQRGTAGALSALDRPIETLTTKTYILYDANRDVLLPLQGHLYRVTRPFQHLRSGAQGAGLFLSGLSIAVDPLTRLAEGRLTGQQALQVVAVRSVESVINAGAAKYGMGVGASAGFAIGEFPGSVVGGAAGAMLFGTGSAILTRWAGNRVLDSWGVSLE